MTDGPRICKPKDFAHSSMWCCKMYADLSVSCTHHGTLCGIAWAGLHFWGLVDFIQQQPQALLKARTSDIPRFKAKVASVLRQ